MIETITQNIFYAHYEPNLFSSNEICIGLESLGCVGTNKNQKYIQEKSQIELYLDEAFNDRFFLIWAHPFNLYSEQVIKEEKKHLKMLWRLTHAT